MGAWAWGLQFHIEVDARIVATWSEVPEYRAALQRVGDGDPAWLTQAAILHARGQMVASCAVVSLAFVTAIETSLASRQPGLAWWGPAAASPGVAL